MSPRPTAARTAPDTFDTWKRQAAGSWPTAGIGDSAQRAGILRIATGSAHTAPRGVARLGGDRPAHPDDEAGVRAGLATATSSTSPPITARPTPAERPRPRPVGDLGRGAEALAPSIWAGASSVTATRKSAASSTMVTSTGPLRAVPPVQVAPRASRPRPRRGAPRPALLVDPGAAGDGCGDQPGSPDMGGQRGEPELYRRPPGPS